MGIIEPFGRLMRWRIRLNEFTFDAEHKKKNLITQADAVSGLKFLGHTSVALDEDIPTHPDDVTLTQEPFALVPDSEVSDRLLLGNSDSQGHLLVLVTTDEMHRELQTKHFCQDLVARLQNGWVLFYLLNDGGIYLLLAYENEQGVILKALQAKDLRLCHRTQPLGHPGDRWIYYLLRHYFYWPSISVACYATV